MVVFDKDRIEQAGTMIVTTAAMNGILFQPTPAERGFASIVNTCAGAFDTTHVFARQRRNSAEPADEVERRTHAREHVASGTRDLRETIARRDILTIFKLRPPFDFGVHLIKKNRRRLQSSGDSWLPRDNRCPTLCVRRNEGNSRPVVLPGKV